MPLQTVEELRIVKGEVRRRYGRYGEGILAAEHVQFCQQKHSKKRALRNKQRELKERNDAAEQSLREEREALGVEQKKALARKKKRLSFISSGKVKLSALSSSPSTSRIKERKDEFIGDSTHKHRIVAVGKYRLYLFKPVSSVPDVSTSEEVANSKSSRGARRTALLTFVKSLVKEYHYYDLVSMSSTGPDAFTLVFKELKSTFRLRIQTPRAPEIITAIRAAYQRVTRGYVELHESCVLPLESYTGEFGEKEEELIADGFNEAYRAQCCYYRAEWNPDVVYLVEELVQKGSRVLDLNECPQVEEPSVMMPLIGALRHNSYFDTILLSDCPGEEKILLLCATMIRFNSAVKKLVLQRLRASPTTFRVLGDSLRVNKNHQLHVLDLSHNAIPLQPFSMLTDGLRAYSHALISLHLRDCQLTSDCIEQLVLAFKGNYGMSLSIQELDLSENKLGKEGSKHLGDWLNMIRDHSHLRMIYLSNCSLNFSFIGKPLVYYTGLESLDVSDNKLDHAAVQLLTLFIESSTSLKQLALNRCGLTGEYAGKLMGDLGHNTNLSETKIYMSGNGLGSSKDAQHIADGLRRCAKLHTLSLANNKFKDKGLALIVSALRDATRQMDTLILDHSLAATIKSTATSAASVSALNNTTASVTAKGDDLAQTLDEAAPKASPTMKTNKELKKKIKKREKLAKRVSKFQAEDGSVDEEEVAAEAEESSMIDADVETFGLGDILALLITENKVRALSIAGGFGVEVVSELFIRLPKKSQQESGGFCRLEEIDISENKIGDAGVSVVASTLRANAHLRCVLLDSNGISMSGWQAFKQVFSRNTSILYSPFPWADYHAAISSTPPAQHNHLRHVLRQIQISIARNARGEGDDADRDDANGLKYALVSCKRFQKANLGAPEEQKPLSTVPVEMPVEMVEDASEFTFSPGDEDEQTVVEFERIQRAALRATQSRKGGDVRAVVAQESSDVDVDIKDTNETPADSIPPQILPRDDLHEFSEAPTLPTRDCATDSEEEEDDDPFAGIPLDEKPTPESDVRPSAIDRPLIPPRDTPAPTPAMPLRDAPAPAPPMPPRDVPAPAPPMPPRDAPSPVKESSRPPPAIVQEDSSDAEFDFVMEDDSDLALDQEEWIGPKDPVTKSAPAIAVGAAAERHRGGSFVIEKADSAPTSIGEMLLGVTARRQYLEHTEEVFSDDEFDETDDFDDDDDEYSDGEW